MALTRFVLEVACGHCGETLWLQPMMMDGVPGHTSTMTVEFKGCACKTTRHFVFVGQTDLGCKTKGRSSDREMGKLYTAPASARRKASR